jgi:hypothetical protein
VSVVKTLLGSERQISIVKVPRSENIASDTLARYSRINDISDAWIGSWPMSY